MIYIRNRKDYTKGKSHIEVLGEPVPTKIKPIIDGVKRGLNAGLAPELTFEGTSGAYFMRNDKQVPIAVFKPIDEEANAPNNPRGFANKFGTPSLRSGVLSGEACEREIAAYLVDKDGFSGVPETVLAAISHPSFNFVGETSDWMSKNSTAYMNEIATIIMIEPLDAADLGSSTQVKTKYGSLQRFAESHDIAENLSEDFFTDDEVHKIAVLDMRILNTDRHACNILVRKTKSQAEDKKSKIHYKLIPIDHGMSMPDSLEILEMEYCWLSWNQRSHPFSQATLKYIESINVMEDVEMLSSQYNFRPICLRNMRMSATILKKGAAAGLTLEEIAKIWCRTDDEGIKPSVFEEIVKSARMRADIMSQNRIYYPLAIAKRKKGLKYKEPISADTETYEKIKAMAEETKATSEKRARSNTTIEDVEAPAGKFTLDNGLAPVKENPVEDERSPAHGSLLGTELSLHDENSSSHCDGFALSKIVRTVSIASMSVIFGIKPIEEREKVACSEKGEK
eukprot:TRINITY_DN13430_c0_g1_i3.p1 TRINITY_DN13430_c0_g1~~TRINITY_DN13430_c0_g1_i3.p1  ORF type:complete len:509 (-),score=135.64 TRINITY_DN13430_c0_g1_i3:204-1730(-)